MTWVDDANASLLTDLYELTMAASYHKRGMNDVTTFDLFVRELPPNRNFLLSCGLEQALRYLENLRFERDSLDYLESLGMFDDAFLDYLSRLSFSGDVDAVPEGTVAFAKEPLLRVTAPLIEAQIVETFLINCIAFQTMVASKAARVWLACGDKMFVDFSPRRDHAADAALKAARATYVGGAAATSNVLAGRIFGLPVTGTMAHSYVMAFENELAAFRAFASDFPDRAILLIDTFDIEEGARRAVQVADELRSQGVELKGVRIDSGDLAGETRAVRKILDEGGYQHTQIILSGDLDEYRIRALLADGVPVDGFGVGTQMGTSADAPALGGVYKLVADQSGPKMKLSAGKATLPGCKQVYRTFDDAHCAFDVIALESEEIEGVPLLEPVMRDGRRIQDLVPLPDLQDRTREQLRCLPDPLRSLDEASPPYEVRVSPELMRLVDNMSGPRRT